MKKTIRILSFISVAIMTLSCVALLACILLQEPLGRIFFGASGQMMAETPSFPIAPLVRALANLAIAVLLMFTVGNQDTNIGTEVTCAVIIGAALPFLLSILSNAQAFFTSQLQVDAVISFNYVNSLCNMALSFVGIATALMLVVCGMNIALKYTQRNTEGALL